MKDKILISVCFGFIFGVLLRSFVGIDFYFAILLCVISLGLILFFALIYQSKGSLVFSCVVLAFSLGILRFHIADKPTPILSSGEYTGLIVDDPDIRDNNQKLVLQIEKTKILVTTRLEERFEYGDIVKILGDPERPENFLTDQGKVFDYVNYLRKDGIEYVMFYPDLVVLKSGEGNPIKGFLFNIKSKFLEAIDFLIKRPESSLLGGLILGERSSFEEEQRQAFIDTGTIHIVALSGYNVTIVAEWIMKAFSFLSPGLAMSFGIFGIFLFVVMAGSGSTAIRAGIMASLALFARMTGRNYEVARILILTAVFMILINPYVLAFDVSFQLSFVATIAVIFLTPKLEKHFHWVTKKFGLRDIISVTFSAYIFVLPFILYKMGNLSLVALPANILVLPFIPLTMFFGFVTGFLGSIWYVLALPFSFLGELLLSYELGVINFFAQVPFASIIVPNFPLVLTVAIYVFFIYIFWRREVKSFLTALS